MNASAAGPLLIRYRFDSSAQFERHVHRLDRGGMIFVADAALSGVAGAPVVLDVAFVASEQRCTLRGELVCRADGVVPGAWLAFAGRAPPRSGGGVVAFARRHQRLPLEALVQVRRRSAPPLVARLTDVSLGGAAVEGVGGALAVGDDLGLTLYRAAPGIPAELGRALVVRASESLAGVRFLRTEPLSRGTVAYLVGVAQHAWESAREVAHPPACCAEGRPVEPPLPLSIFRARREG